MKKIFTVIIILSFISVTSFAQQKELPEMHQKDSALPINVIKGKIVNVSDNSKQVKKIKAKKSKKSVKKYKKPVPKTDKDLKLHAILTPEQKEKIKEAKENKPRRGVTTMPNERTAK